MLEECDFRNMSVRNMSVRNMSVRNMSVRNMSVGYMGSREVGGQCGYRPASIISFLKSFFQPSGSNMQALTLIISPCEKVVLLSNQFSQSCRQPLDSNTYFESHSYPPSGCNQLFEMGKWRLVRFVARISEHIMARQPSQGDMAGIDVGPRCDKRAVRLYWSFPFSAVDK